MIRTFEDESSTLCILDVSVHVVLSNNVQHRVILHVEMLHLCVGLASVE